MASSGDNVCPTPPSSPREWSPDPHSKRSITPELDLELKRRRVQVQELEKQIKGLTEKNKELERDASLAWDINAAQQNLISCHEQLDKVSSTRPLDDPEEFTRLRSEIQKAKAVVNDTGFICED